MKKQVLKVAGMVVLGICMVSFAAGAAQVGNVAAYDREKGNFTLELGAEHLTRQMELEEKATIYATSATVYYSVLDNGEEYYGEYVYLTGLEEIETIDRYFLKASFKLANLEVYGKFGLARLISKWEHSWWEAYTGYYNPEYEEEQEDGYKFEIPLELGLEQSDWGTFYGAGVKLIFYSKPDFNIALDAQYLTQKNKERGFFAGSYYRDYGNGDSSEIYTESGGGGRINESTTTEMHIALVLSGTMGKLSPYGGIKFSQMRTEYKGEFFVFYQEDTTYTETPISSFEFTMKQKDSFGMFAGADYHFTDRIKGNFEIRVLDETALSVALGIEV
ncbi:hypothetical protein H5U35_10400 [Candidatus Aerophobetes bacterium]|nr:hypothetical protein [Candidatus Aerophobetes bacterium]